MSDQATVEAVARTAAEFKQAVGDVRTTQEALKATVAEQANRIKQLEDERAAARTRVRTPWADGGDDARRAYRHLSPTFSLTAAFQAWAHRRGVPGFERGVDKDALIRAGHFPEAVERAMSGKILTDGGFLIPDAFMPEIIAALLPRLVTAQLGVQMLQVGDRAGQIRWPKQNSRPTVTAVPEAGAPTESTPTWQQVVATPHKAGMLMSVPNEVLRFGTPQTEAFLMQLLQEELRIEMDTRILRGTGSANLPLGIVNMDAIQNPAVGVNGGPITYNLITDLITLVEESNTRGTKFGFATSPRGLREIHQVVDGNSRPLFLITETGEQLAGMRPGKILGFPVATTTIIPTDISKGSGVNLTELYFCAWDEVLHTLWGGIDVLESKEATDGTNNAFTMDLTLARAFVTYDVVAFHNAALGVINDMNSA